MPTHVEDAAAHDVRLLCVRPTLEILERGVDRVFRPEPLVIEGKCRDDNPVVADHQALRAVQGSGHATHAGRLEDSGTRTDSKNAKPVSVRGCHRKVSTRPRASVVGLAESVATPPGTAHGPKPDLT